MEEKSQLIQWQRITIAALLIILTCLTVFCYTQILEASAAKAEAKRVQDENDSLVRENKNHKSVIHWADKHIKKFEAKYGPIEPGDSCRGVYCNDDPGEDK